MTLSSTINIRTFSLRLSSFCFTLLFVGFALYHTLVINHIIPAFLGGFFPLASVLSFLLLSPFLIRFLKQSLETSLLLSFFQIVMFVVASLTTFIYIYYDGLFSAAVLQSLLILFLWLTLILVGYYFAQYPKDKLLKSFIIFSSFYLLYIFYYMISNGSVILSFGVTEDFEHGQVSGYQGIARSFLLIAFVCVAFLNHRLHSFIASIGFAITLFAIGARSEFYAFIAAILAYHSVLSFKIKSSIIVIFALFLSITLLGAYFFEDISESRQFQVFNLDQSTSWSAREEFKARSIQQISQNPILGNFGGHVRDGFSGANAHNIVSAYNNYGLIFFILYLLLTIATTIKSAVSLINNPNSKEWGFCFLLSFTVLLLLFTAKSVFWEVTYLSWGVFFGTVYLSHINKKAPKGSINTLEYPSDSKPQQHPLQ